MSTRELAKRFGDQHHKLHKIADSTIILECFAPPEGKRGHTRNTRRRFFILFDHEKLKEVRILIKGKSKLKWRP